MAANLLLTTEVRPDAASAAQAIAEWTRLRAETGSGSSLYRSIVDDTLLELTALTDLADLDKERAFFATLFTGLAPFVTGDFRRQVLEFVEAPKGTDALLPDTPYIQLRHIEVPPVVSGAYRQWRERTIFEVIRRAPAVEVFLAYHSLLSTEPGVMFVSGFRVEPDQYAAVFATEEYQDIVREAGSSYISGGERGLYTKIYRRIDHR